MLQWLWGGMVASSVLYALAQGQAAQVLDAALSGTGSAIRLTLQLGAGYLLFCGWMEIGKGLGLPALLARLTRPLLHFLMPNVRNENARQAIALNLSMNMLGLGNAATPMGVQAVRLMSQETSPQIGQDIAMLLILNATSLQCIPTTVLTLRAAAGSVQPGAILWPGLLCGVTSTFVGVSAGLLCRRFGGRIHG